MRDPHAGQRGQPGDPERLVEVRVDVLHGDVHEPLSAARTGECEWRAVGVEHVAHLREHGVAERGEVGVVRVRLACGGNELLRQRDDHVVDQGHGLALAAGGDPVRHLPRSVEVGQHALADAAQRDLAGHAVRHERDEPGQ